MALPIWLIAAITVSGVATKTCPNGGQVFEQGISEMGKMEVVYMHNWYRREILAGRVPCQPRGTGLKRMHYDDWLGMSARSVSNSCTLRHNFAKDPRWKWVGQNLYIEYSSAMQYGQNWTAAVKSWFEEHEDFGYPNKMLTGRPVGHYTQVVWAETDHIGCDFIFYYNPNNPSLPYTKLYTCNYGPGGNVNRRAPYRIRSRNLQE